MQVVPIHFNMTRAGGLPDVSYPLSLTRNENLSNGPTGVHLQMLFPPPSPQNIRTQYHSLSSFYAHVFPANMK